MMGMLCQSPIKLLIKAVLSRVVDSKVPKQKKMEKETSPTKKQGEREKRKISDLFLPSHTLCYYTKEVALLLIIL